MKFTKMHGLGNDYAFVDCFHERVFDAPALARAMSDRHGGVGGDGLILIRPSEVAPVRMDMYNADGSRSQMCGNGIRCLAKYVLEHGLIGCRNRVDRAAAPGRTAVAESCEVAVETDAGIKVCQCHVTGGVVRSVCVDMGRPMLSAGEIPTTLPVERVVDHPLRVLLPEPHALTRGRPTNAAEFAVTCVSMGNPHAVIFVDDLHTIDLAAWGAAIENARVFPQRINVHFVRVDAEDHVTMRTWERGSGATRACGTGACAVCVAGVVTGRTRHRITASLPGGDLQIEWAGRSKGPESLERVEPSRIADHVYKTGPAVEVFTGVWPD